MDDMDKLELRRLVFMYIVEELDCPKPTPELIENVILDGIDHYGSDVQLYRALQYQYS